MTIIKILQDCGWELHTWVDGHQTCRCSNISYARFVIHICIGEEFSMHEDD